MISEIGINYKCDLNIAIDLIKLSKECGETVVKFQKRDILTLLTTQQYDSPHLVQCILMAKRMECIENS